MYYLFKPTKYNARTNRMHYCLKILFTPILLRREKALKTQNAFWTFTVQES